MPYTRCEYILFGKRHESPSLRDALRHLLKELHQRYPEALKRAAKGRNIMWLIYSPARYREIPYYFYPDTSLNRNSLRSWSEELLREMWVSPRAFQVIGFRTK